MSFKIKNDSNSMLKVISETRPPCGRLVAFSALKAGNI